MSCILCLETATKVCSVALSRDNTILFEKEDCSGPSHAALLGVFVHEAVTFSRENNLKIDAVAVSEGPGSYTGLRIGVSEAKGLCYGLNVPLIAVPTLEILLCQALKKGYRADYYCPMIDAKRMEVYSAVYDSEWKLLKAVAAEIIGEKTCSEFLSKGSVLFFGDGSDKCKSVFLSENAVFAENIYPLASAMPSLAHAYYNAEKYRDVAYFEPFYLKEFQATTPKNKIINTVKG